MYTLTLLLFIVYTGLFLEYLLSTDANQGISYLSMLQPVLELTTKIAKDYDKSWYYCFYMPVHITSKHCAKETELEENINYKFNCILSTIVMVGQEMHYGQQAPHYQPINSTTNQLSISPLIQPHRQRDKHMQK